MDDLDEVTLDALMARLAVGERSAFDPLFRALYQRARRLAQARLGNDADDVAQAALLKVFARAHEFTPGRSLLAWFYAIVANEITSARRKSRTPRIASDPFGDAAASAEELAIDGELARALDRAIAELDPNAMEAIHGLLGRGPKPALEPATLRKRISRAYARLRHLLGDLP